MITLTTWPTARCSSSLGFDGRGLLRDRPGSLARALGEPGLAGYRDAVTARRDGDSFAVRHARERLVSLDRDVDAVVTARAQDGPRPPVQAAFLKVVVAYEGREGRIITAFGRRSMP